MNDNKTYKVIKIINNTSILINGGEDNEIKKNDEFEIYQPGIEVKDPDTDEILGILDYVKAVVTATTVYEKMSICQQIEIIPTSIQRLPTSIYADNKQVQFLNVDYEQISGGFENVDKTIRIGDLVRAARG